MELVATDRNLMVVVQAMLEAYDSPAILLTQDYKIIASNSLYKAEFGDLERDRSSRCFEVSHGYTVPCDQAGEDCPLSAARASGNKERALHIHQTSHGKEYVDVTMIPIQDGQDKPLYFVELLKVVPSGSSTATTGKMVGTSKPFKDMLEKITRVSVSDFSVLLLGESGTGKELAAQAIHEGSSRSKKPMVTLECAGLSETLFESELFGHAKGAFTGAHSNRVGLAEMANGGTLFLDEIGDVPLPLQVKLLRLLESGTFRAVGSSTVKTANFRLVCATHKHIDQMVRDGSFRQDLYYRINVFPIRIPALRERGDDLKPIAESLLQSISASTSPQGAFRLSEPALRLLAAYSFPGNIRELRNILTRAVVLSDSNEIGGPVMEESLASQSEQLVAEVAPPEEQTLVDIKTAERQYIERVMIACNGDKAEAACVAGISLRSLYRKLDAMQRSSGGAA